MSPWFPLVLVVYPVWETLFSILRRATLHRAPIGAPDALHLHSLVHRRLVVRVFTGTGARAVRWRNAATALPFWLVQGAMVALGVAHYDSTQFLVAQAYGFLGVYCVLYALVARLPPHAPAAT